MKTKKIILENKEIEISKLPLGKYSELLLALEELPKQLSGVDGKSAEDFLAELPKIIGNSLPDVIKILTIATPLKEEEIKELGLDEVIEIILAIFEVNNYQSVFDNIKKLTARPEKVK